MQTKLAALLLLLGACSVDPAPDAGGAPIDNVSPDSAQPPPAPTGLEGLVELATVRGGNNRPFAHAELTDVLYGPVAGHDGACTVHDALVVGPTFSAGDITIGGTTSPIQLHPEGVAPSVAYATDDLPSPLFAPGASISFNIGGTADVLPSVAVVLAPAPLAGFTAPATLSRAGYTATWTPGTNAGITILLGTSDPQSSTFHIIECHAADTGSFTIPASTFALVPATETIAQLSIGRSAAATVGANDIVITTRVSNYVLADTVPLTP